MTLRDLLEKCKALEVFETRTAGDEYCELVFLRKDDERLNAIFSGAMGPAVKPKGVAPTRDDNELTKKYGGIARDQILFKKETGTGTIMAMFWPWQNGLYVTIKMVRFK